MLFFHPILLPLGLDQTWIRRTTAHRLALKQGAVEELVHLLLAMTYSVPGTLRNIQRGGSTKGWAKGRCKMCRKSHGESWEAMGSHGKSWKWGDCHWVDVKNEGPSANSRLAVAMGQFTMVPWWTWMFVNYGTVWLSDVSMKNHYVCLFGNHRIIIYHLWMGNFP